MLTRLSVLALVLLLASPAQVYAAKKDELKLITSYLTSGDRDTPDEFFKRTDSIDFKHEDVIFYIGNFTWEDFEKSGGRHETKYIWYSNGNPVGAPKWKGVFKTAPWEVRTNIWAATLGYGEHKVELYVDNELVDTKNFKVVKD
ncbi:hypothetical protein [Aurantivibrio infirmus]